MRRVLVDLNVVTGRAPQSGAHAGASSAVWAAVENGTTEGPLAAHAVTTLHYQIRQEQGTAKATRTLRAILRVFGVARVDGPVIQEALELAGPDFEDSVTASAARPRRMRSDRDPGSR